MNSSVFSVIIWTPDSCCETTEEICFNHLWILSSEDKEEITTITSKQFQTKSCKLRNTTFMKSHSEQ